MKFDIQGFSILLAQLKKIEKEVPTELDKALYKEASDIFRESQKIVPVRTGVLRGSGVIEGPLNGEILIGYGGPASPYALYVHEDLEAKHKPGKTAKFLERPFMAAQQGMEERLAKVVEDAAGE